MRWLGRHERGVLVGVALVALGLWGFLAIADEMTEGETHAFDERVLLALRTPGNPDDPIGPRVVEEVMRDVTALGGTFWLTFLTLAVTGYLVLDGKRHAALFVFASVATGLALSSVLKTGYDRPRPDLVAHGSYVFTKSFPSGHAMGSAVVYLTLGALLARLSRRWRTRAYVLLLAVLLTVLIGVSRVYLGVHWPTDVLAGWSAGATWALFCWTLALRLQRRGDIETGSQRSPDAES
jgi:undecaprenyl-diphosphatase